MWLVQSETVRSRGKLHGVTTIRIRGDTRDFSCDLIGDGNDNVGGRRARCESDHALDAAKGLCQATRSNQ
jgi:hypothetical protein